MRIGLDFGTTNTGAAFFGGARVRAFPLDPASQDPTVMRSTLYITRNHTVLAGREVVDTYYRQNVGRPSRWVHQHVGEIERCLAIIFHYWVHLGKAHAIRRALGHTHLPDFRRSVRRALRCGEITKGNTYARFSGSTRQANHIFRARRRSDAR